MDKEIDSLQQQYETNQIQSGKFDQRDVTAKPWPLELQREIVQKICNYLDSGCKPLDTLKDDK